MSHLLEFIGIGTARKIFTSLVIDTARKMFISLGIGTSCIVFTSFSFSIPAWNGPVSYQCNLWRPAWGVFLGLLVNSNHLCLLTIGMPGTIWQRVCVVKRLRSSLYRPAEKQIFSERWIVTNNSGRGAVCERRIGILFVCVLWATMKAGVSMAVFVFWS